MLSARWVLPIAGPPVAEGALALDDGGVVKAVGSRADLRARFPAWPEERAGGALVPGLVNAHTHLELAALAGAVPGGRGLVAWATALMDARRAPGPTRAAADAAEAAARALRAAGTAAVGDVGASIEAAVPAIAAAGLAGVFFHELVGSREAATGDALADARRERDDFTARAAWPAGLGYAVAPHAPYSVPPELFRRLFAAATRAGHATTVHLAEDPDEIALLRDGGGAWPPILARLGVPPGSRTAGLGPAAYLASLGAFAGPRPPLLVHMVHAAAEDVAIAARHRAPVVLCPRSNLHIGGRLPDVPAFVAAGVPLALGTDSLASNEDVALWGEIAALARAFPALPPSIWLEAATAGGADALGLPHLGRFAPGARPGVLDVALGDARAPLASLASTPRPELRWLALP